MLKTGDTFEQNGKTWRLVGVAVPEVGQCWIASSPFSITRDPSMHYRPIVEEVIPEWITPTDEHAKQRPYCEVLSSDGKWLSRILIYVASFNGSPIFVTYRADNGSACTFLKCRIRNPEYKD
jgi:hypothetical protein